MAFNIFGFEIRSKKERELEDQKNLLAFTSQDDGNEESVDATPIGGYGGGGQYGLAIDIDGSVKDDNHLITIYRTMAVYPEVDYAIDDIVNEAIVDTDHEFCVSLNTDNTKLSDSLKTKITDEFEEVLEKLDFKLKAYDIFRRWYVDGRIYYHIVIDKDAPQLGIQELRYIDPRKIKKIIVKPKKTGVKAAEEAKNPIAKKPKEYYVYNQKGLDAKNTHTIPIAPDAIAYNGSGLQDATRKRIIGNLHKAIRPWNQLKMLEDAVVIYRISRAPERRVFYVDVGSLPKNKAEAYLKDLMVRFKNKVTYNAETGDVQDARYHRTMLEDFWLPRREGGKGTEVTTLAGGQNLGEIEDILFFRRKLYQALNVPRTRMESDTGFSIGRDTEITRDEVKFSKMIQRLRNRFALLFLDLLEKQLLLKKVVTVEDWKMIRKDLRFDWKQDTHFMELQEIAMHKERAEVVQIMDEFVGTYFSKEWVQKNILHQTDEDIKKISQQIRKEADDGETIERPAGMPDGSMGAAVDQEMAPEPTPEEPNPQPKPASAMNGKGNKSSSKAKK